MVETPLYNQSWAVVVAQLVERSLPKPMVRGSYPVSSKNSYWTFVYCLLHWKGFSKEKWGREWKFFEEKSNQSCLGKKKFDWWFTLRRTQQCYAIKKRFDWHGWNRRIGHWRIWRIIIYHLIIIWHVDDDDYENFSGKLFSFFLFQRDKNGV